MASSNKRKKESKSLPGDIGINQCITTATSEQRSDDIREDKLLKLEAFLSFHFLRKRKETLSFESIPFSLEDKSGLKELIHVSGNELYTISLHPKHKLLLLNRMNYQKNGRCASRVERLRALIQSNKK